MTTGNTKWRLGIDLGTNSLGWAALELAEDDEGQLRPCGLRASGARVFSDGRDAKSKASNAATRREWRGARKNRDRYLRRRQRLLDQLVAYGLMPEDKDERKTLEQDDPWILRYRALRERLTPYQFGRALFHLHQRRGFQSNRKSDSQDDERGKIKEAIKRTKAELEEKGVRTLGELFGKQRLETLQHNQHAPKGQRQPLPMARVKKSGEGQKWQYDYYPTRALIVDEFDALWETQAGFHTALLHPQARGDLRKTIKFQHRLKPQPVGKCALDPEQPRAAEALPSSQWVRIYQEVNHLRIEKTGHNSRELTLEQRDAIVERLLRPTTKQARLTFEKMKELLNLASDEGFNLESGRREHLLGEETAARMMQPEYWGKQWLELSLEQQDEIIRTLSEEEDENKAIQWLCERFDFDEDQAERIADCPLPMGHGRLSAVAIARILPELQREVITYYEACQRAGYDSAGAKTGEVFDELPYYGQILERSTGFGSGEPEHQDQPEKFYGKIANPTVHVAMNQLRRVVNDLLRRFGTPEQVVIEMARDLPQSAKRKKEREKEQKENTEANAKRAQALEQEYKQPNTYQNRLRLRLYEELKALNKHCVFTGESIGASTLFSPEVEVEHILPFSRTFDDGISNKVLCKRHANRDKGNRTPFEAFCTPSSGYDWEAISRRAAELPTNKRWRFNEDAMKRFEEDGGFLARQLNDTRYVSRLAKGYLESLFGDQGNAGSTQKLWVINGRLTADLRHQWGLNSVLLGDNLSEDEKREMQKNREDHRHHAIDAIVVGCTDRAMLQQAAKEAQHREDLYDDRLMADTPDPWKGFRDDVKQVVRDIVVSHKPDHGYQGGFLEASAYGLVKGRQPDRQGKKRGVGKHDVVIRKPLADLKPKDLADIRDERLQYALDQATRGLSGKDFSAALTAAGNGMNPPVHKVRLLLKHRSVRPIVDQQGKEYKAYTGGSNYCCDIWQEPDGCSWRGEIIPTFEAYQIARDHGEQWWRKPIGRDGQPLVMRIRKNDYLEIDFNGRRTLVVVYKMTNGRVFYAEHFQSNVAARSNATVRRGKIPEHRWLQETSQTPAGLQKLNARAVTVSPSGEVRELSTGKQRRTNHNEG